jgi:hypothetical protein
MTEKRDCSMSKIFTKGRIVALSVVAVLAVAGVAYAYFTSTGTGTGNATVGTSTAFTVAVAAPTGGLLYPGSGTDTLSYTVHNPGAGAENLSATTAVVASSGGNITQSGTPVVGCLSAWFTATNTAPTLPQDLAGGGTSTAGSVAVTMSDSGTSQNPCENATPDITVSAS